ncbi:hypothetical protein MPL3356_350083 [Mesorhizobium plurifarium]|uniref:Uncharacterized protein n=1 Tax=Mesorhizobium plurifarium TaxID=69974 RepID=A0A090DWI9_MESPL|nr:hypothetical protein MPL3356_350083 [Mesorhizobium plurifarium]
MRTSGIEFLRRDNDTGKYVTVIAVFRGQSTGRIKDRLKADGMTGKGAGNLTELVLAIDGRPADVDAFDLDHYRPCSFRGSGTFKLQYRWGRPR